MISAHIAHWSLKSVKQWQWQEKRHERLRAEMYEIQVNRCAKQNCTGKMKLKLKKQTKGQTPFSCCFYVLFLLSFLLPPSIGS